MFYPCHSLKEAHLRERRNKIKVIEMDGTATKTFYKLLFIKIIKSILKDNYSSAARSFIWLSAILVKATSVTFSLSRIRCNSSATSL